MQRGEDGCEVGREGFVGWCERHSEAGAGFISMKVGIPCEGNLLLLSCSLHLHYRKGEGCTTSVCVGMLMQNLAWPEQQASEVTYGGHRDVCYMRAGLWHVLSAFPSVVLSDKTVHGLSFGFQLGWGAK